MELMEAIRASGRKFCSAYRYHKGELIFAVLSFSHSCICFYDSRGYINGFPVYPPPEAYTDKHDWQPFTTPKEKAL